MDEALSYIVNPNMRRAFGLDGFGTPSIMDALRELAMKREGMSPPFRPRGEQPIPQAPPDKYASGLPAGVVGDLPIDSSPPMIPVGEGVPSFTGQRDPYAALDDARSAELGRKPALPFAGMLNEMGLINVPQPPAAAPTDSPFDVGGSPMAGPRPSGAAAPGSVTLRPPVEDVASIPARAVPTARTGAAPTTPRDIASPGAGFLSRISNVLASNPSTLLALGAGFSGAQNIGQGMSRAFGAAVPAVKQDQLLQTQRQGIEGTYRALVEMGVTPQEALAAAYNPDVLKAMTQRLFGMNRKWGIISHDDFGNPVYGFIDETQGSVVPGSKVTVPQVKTREEVLRLPKGTHFIGWDGNEYVR